MFAPLTQAQFTSGLCTENDWLLTSAFDNISLSLSDRYQKKKKKDTKLSLHGACCDIRSFFPPVTLPSSGNPPPPARFWMLIFGGQCSPGGQDAGARPQEAPCASPSLSSSVSIASPDLSKILSPALPAVSLRLLCPESLPAPREGLSYLPTSSLPCFSGEWLLNCFSEDTYYRVTFSHSNSLIQRNSSYQ